MNHNFYRNWVRIAFAGGVFLLLSHLLPTLISGVAEVEIIAKFDHADKLQLYWTNHIHAKNFQDKYARETQAYNPDEKFRAKIRLNNRILQTLRLDTGTLPGDCYIYRITIKRLFAQNLTFNAKEIYQRFKPGTDSVGIQFEKGYVKIASSAEDPYIVSKGRLLDKPGFFLSYILPLIFTTVFYRFFNFDAFNMTREVQTKRPSEGINYDALDGLRGIAALMVIADHTMGFFTGVGASGVWIFFGLSGFLLAKPFVQHPQSVLNFQYMENYFVKRLRRILPMYYTYIFVVFFVSGRYGDAFRHFLFLQGNGHLWAIPQEMLFYLVAPFLFVVICGLFRGKTYFAIPFVIALICLSNEMLHKGVFSLVGMNYIHLPFFLGTFLSGVLFSYCHFGLYVKIEIPKHIQKLAQYGFAILAIFLLLFLCLFSTGRIIGSSEIFAQSHFGWFGVLAGLLIWSIMISHNTVVSRFFAFTPFRLIGLLSFSIYLIHPLVIEIIKGISLLYFNLKVTGFGLFVMTVSISYLIACITYRAIEVPCSHKP